MSVCPDCGIRHGDNAECGVAGLTDEQFLHTKVIFGYAALLNEAITMAAKVGVRVDVVVRDNDRTNDDAILIHAYGGKQERVKP